MTKKIKLKISARLVKKRTRRGQGNLVKTCRFCSRTDQSINMDYKNTAFLKNFLTERAKILPSRISGTCNLHQRELARLIRKARTMALLPYTAQFA
jgi:small subunit ribosomal protein S18